MNGPAIIVNLDAGMGTGLGRTFWSAFMKLEIDDKNVVHVFEPTFGFTITLFSCLQGQACAVSCCESWWC